MSAMRVALGDDSALFREGLRRLLEGEGIEVTAWAANPDEIWLITDEGVCLVGASVAG